MNCPMNDKQKKMLIRILTAGALTAALVILFHFWDAPAPLRLVFFLAPYVRTGVADFYEDLKAGIPSRPQA